MFDTEVFAPTPENFRNTPGNTSERAIWAWGAGNCNCRDMKAWFRVAVVDGICMGAMVFWSPTGAAAWSCGISMKSGPEMGVWEFLWKMRKGSCWFKPFEPLYIYIYVLHLNYRLVILNLVPPAGSASCRWCGASWRTAWHQMWFQTLCHLH